MFGLHFRRRPDISSPFLEPFLLRIQVVPYASLDLVWLESCPRCRPPLAVAHRDELDGCSCTVTLNLSVNLVSEGSVELRNETRQRMKGGVKGERLENPGQSQQPFMSHATTIFDLGRKRRVSKRSMEPQTNQAQWLTWHLLFD